MHGEHRILYSPAISLPGSSPHARGTPHGSQSEQQVAGIIPACTGNTERADAFAAALQDHPRMHGEHCQIQGGVSYFSGIIPACTGNTNPTSFKPIGVKDHPRMHGEHPRQAQRQMAKRGSSPHARGTQYRDHRLPILLGIIPACTGNTTRWRGTISRHEDHPRMHGEHMLLSIAFAERTGSSPHARGTQGPKAFSGDTSRIIPACTGNTIQETTKN
ncbi:hypothetical protein BOCO_0657 [Bombiscardovia coagulans]|uniref:Uncharacterized protein n=1 Tax=Bombiscardovia coagulans TaxID=686666 RepID=A0A261ETF9_9BIFI|nr:hypothetical protein BOCO_0657 [Bombiscardovia coagulans]